MFAVIGAGVLGRLIALRLSQEGHQVALFDRGDSEGRRSCAYAAAGMLAPDCEQEKAGSFMTDMGIASLELWPKILASLEREVFFRQQGSLVVARPEEMGELRHFHQQTQRSHCGNYAALSARICQELHGDSLRELEPDLDGRFLKGLYFPREGQVDNRDFLRVASETLMKRGVRLYWHEEVLELQPSLVITAQRKLTCETVIDTRGLGAKLQTPGGSVMSGLRGVRGELIHIISDEVRLQRPVRLLHPRHSIYVVPRPQGRFLVGATSIESEEDGPITLRSAVELLSSAFLVSSGFSEARVVECDVGLRPAFTHHQPRIHWRPGLIQVNGLYRHGFMIGPKIAEISAELAMQGKLGSAQTTNPHLFNPHLFEEKLFL